MAAVSPVPRAPPTAASALPSPVLPPSVSAARVFTAQPMNPTLGARRQSPSDTGSRRSAPAITARGSTGHAPRVGTRAASRPTCAKGPMLLPCFISPEDRRHADGSPPAIAPIHMLSQPPHPMARLNRLLGTHLSAAPTPGAGSPFAPCPPLETRHDTCRLCP